MDARYKKNLQKKKLLLSNENFINEIKGIRYKWTRGKILSGEEYTKWWEKIYEKSEKVNIKVYHQKAPVNKFWHDINNLRMRFHLNNQ